MPNPAQSHERVFLSGAEHRPCFLAQINSQGADKEKDLLIAADEQVLQEARLKRWGGKHHAVAVLTTQEFAGNRSCAQYADA
jgi:hypothetical protein